MTKTPKFFWTTFLALILIFNNLFSFLAVAGGNSLNKVHAADLKVNIPLNFTPTHSIIHPSKPILYFTDMAGKKVYSINYETGETKSIQFDLPVERITFANDEIYVTVLKTGHKQYLPTSENATGAVAIIDANNFTLKNRFDVDIDPFDIAVDSQNFIYLSNGINYALEAKSYSRDTKSKVDSIYMSERSYIQFNPKNDKIYSIAGTMTAYKIDNGEFLGDGYDDSPHYGHYKLLPKFRISPDGKYIFNTSGVIFKSTDSKYDDMTYVTSLNSEFFDIAFDVEHNKFYTAVKGNKIAVYNYNDFNVLKYYYAPGTVDSLFFQDDDLIAVSKDSKNRYFIQSVSLYSPVTISDADKDYNENKYAVTTAKYDSSRNKVYALNKTLDNLFVMDAETNKLERIIKLPYKPSNLTISEDFSKLYIVNEDENYLASEYDLNDFSNTRNLSYKIPRNLDLYNGHRHIYEKNNKLYIVDGSYPKLFIFDANSFDEIKYSPIIKDIGDIAFSSDGKYIYKWEQYYWPSSTSKSDVIKYSIDGNSVKEVEKSNLDYPHPNEEPLDVPVIVLENKNLLIYRNKVFKLNDLSKPIRNFSEQIYAVDESRNLAVGRTRIYNLDTGEAIRVVPSHNINTMFFDNAGKLHLFNEKDMYSMDPLTAEGTLEVLRSMPSGEGEDTPIDLPLVVQFSDKIALVNQDNISITDGKDYYGTDAFISEDMLVIAHDDLPYETKLTLEVGENTVNSIDGKKSNSKFTINFYTGKQYNRIAGSNRYETSVKVSEQWSSCKYAVLASGQDFPDALSAAPLASKYDAPILLTNPKKLDIKTEAEIRRLGVSEIFIVGGYASVSKDIENKLTSNGIKVTRLQGKDRYQTSMAIANFIGTNGQLFIAAGSNFPDALSVASYAAAKGIPIILTEKNRLPDGFVQYVSQHPINKAYLIGGPGVINGNMLWNYIADTERIYGNNRYETNLMVLSKFEFYFGTTFIASGQGFADALSASALAGLTQSPIVLADKSLLGNKEVVAALKDSAHMMKIRYTIGGEGSVPSYVIDRIFK
ncbi:MAG: hypothetical protein E7211_04690 [Clostridium lundense]|nr:hypothetical protein [Clostridium lundense]